MTGDQRLTADEREQAQWDINNLRPLWCAPTPPVSFIQILNAKSTGDTRLLSGISLAWALRPARLDQGGSVAIVPRLKTPPSVPGGLSFERLSATWVSPETGERRGAWVYFVTGVDLALAKRLGGRGGLPWLLFCGEETQGRVILVRDGGSEDLGMYSNEVFLTGIASALQVESVEVERQATNWIEAMMAARFQDSDTRLQKVP